MTKMRILCVFLFLCLLIVAVTGCDSKAQTSDETVKTLTSTEVKSFSKYGFSFEYPRNFAVWTEGLLGSKPDADSGIVQVAPEEQGAPLFAVSWVKTWQWGLDGGLEAGFEGIRNLDGVDNIEMGEIQDATKTGPRLLYKKGHPLLYRHYTAGTKTEGETVYGIVGSFYCDETRRMFSLVTMSSTTGTPSSEQAFDDFEVYLKSLVCHP